MFNYTDGWAPKEVQIGWLDAIITSLCVHSNYSPGAFLGRVSKSTNFREESYLFRRARSCGLETALSCSEKWSDGHWTAYWLFSHNQWELNPELDTWSVHNWMEVIYVSIKHTHVTSLWNLQPPWANFCLTIHWKFQKRTTVWFQQTGILLSWIFLMSNTLEMEETLITNIQVVLSYRVKM